MRQKLNAMTARLQQIRRVAGKGLVAGLACMRPGTTEPDADMVITEEAMMESVSVLEEAFTEAVTKVAAA